jgi:hypothetical protein
MHFSLKRETPFDLSMARCVVATPLWGVPCARNMKSTYQWASHAPLQRLAHPPKATTIPFLLLGPTGTRLQQRPPNQDPQ